MHQSLEGGEFDWCLLSRAGTEVMLNTMYESERRPSEPDAERAAAHSDTMLYFACRDLDSAYKHLRAHDVRVVPPPVARYGMRQLLFSDLDGYGICLQWAAEAGAAEEWRKRYDLDISGA